MPVIVNDTRSELQIVPDEPKWVKENSGVREFSYFSEFMGYKTIITLVAVILFGTLACLKYQTYVINCMRIKGRCTSYVLLP